MKKIIPTFIVSTVVAFIIGCQCGYHGCESKYRAERASYEEYADFKDTIIKHHQICDSLAIKVMNNNELLDTDGGDDMTKFLEEEARLDSLYATQM